MSFTPWVGYYPFYFAIEKQIPEKYNADLRVLETLTVQDFRRANVKEHVDAFASSLMELTRSNSILQQPIEIIAFLDYSNCADVIVASKDIANMQELQGKVVGFDWRSLGHYFLQKASQFENLESDSYQHRQVEQVVAHEYFNEGTLDAYITYPPISTQLLKDENLHVIFDSSKIPFQIMDVLAMKKGDVNKREILFDIWKDTTNYIKQHPEEYAEFLAKLMNSSTGKVKEELAQLIMIDADMQSQVSREDLVELMLDGCKILGEESDACKNQLRKIHFINRPIVEL